MKKYFNDPSPLTLRYTGKCAECDTTLKKGTSAYYWPSDGKIYCLACGESEYRQFLSAADDDEVYLGMGNPFAANEAVYQGIEKLTPFFNFLLFF